MHVSSSPGPDGFGPAFYRAFWPLLEDSVMAVLHAFHRGNADLARINQALVVLLPKKSDVTSADGFRPISLQKCVPKLAAKMLTTRLQGAIPTLISDLQTGFVKGRSITDNFLFASELLQCCRKRGAPTIALKLDFRKAFDSISWAALDRILDARGFGAPWRAWMSALLSSGRAAILLNGVPGPWIQCKRGLRQGDPLSPYLFIIVADLLHRMISDAAAPLPLRHPLVDDLDCPVIQYADDTLVLLRAEEPQVRRLKTVLDSFASATGLTINYSKSTFVPINVDAGAAAHLAGILGCAVASFSQTYLGLPLSDTKLPARVLDDLAIRVERCIPSWRVHLLNRGGRLTLTNAVMSLKPIHAMAAIRFPKSTVERMDKPRRGMFWKGAPRCSGGDCQVAWTMACRLKEEDGLGIIDISTQDTCLLLKTVHKLLTGDSNPWANWVRYWYTPECNPSPTASWAMFQGLLPTYHGIVGVTVGRGDSTSFWFDNWTSVGALATALPALLSHCTNSDITVRAALQDGMLNLPLQARLSAVTGAELQGLSTKLTGLQLGEAPDGRHLLWGDERSFRSGVVYKMLKRTGCTVRLADTNWDNFAPIRVKVFFWILRHGNTRTRSFLHRHGALGVEMCPFCPSSPEDIDHLFFSCPRLAAFWAFACPVAAPRMVPELAASLPLLEHRLRNTAVLLLLWIVWKNCNRKIFDNIEQDYKAMNKLIVDHAKLWTSRAPRRLDCAALELWCSSLPV
ncbi:unnamed protein product [Urochloa decumbens]|uniref:Reverse transcriptase domain-containing protein n=1 Tax=Urochloa decumbens TaxID=240449 RepID=A0ABC9DIP5_9POAL